jgi:hypothetical protein
VAQPRLTLEPRQVESHISRRPNQPKTSTRREPSAFKLIKTRRKAPSKCSRCHAIGHTITSKSCPLRFKDSVAQMASLSGLVPPPHTTSEPAPKMVQTEEARDALVSRQTASIDVTVELPTDPS